MSFTSTLQGPLPDGSLYRCPRCGFGAWREPDGFEHCTFSWWKDYGQDDAALYVLSGVPNDHPILQQALQKFRALAASGRLYLGDVRAPKSEDL